MDVMPKVCSLLLLMLASLIPVKAQPSPSTPQPLDDPEAYKVYAALLPEEWTVQAAHAKTLVFQAETTTEKACVPSGPSLETDWLPVMQDFKSANATPKFLRADVDLGVPYVVVASADIEATLRSSKTSETFGWDGFYKKFPDSGGYMMVSVVGFDAQKQRAIVYMAHSCGGLCGGGTYHFLEKSGGVWRRARAAGITNCAWAS